MGTLNSWSYETKRYHGDDGPNAPGVSGDYLLPPDFGYITSEELELTLK